METSVKTPQAKRTVKTPEKSQAQTTKNNHNDLFFSSIIEQLENVEEKHWQHFLKENVSFTPANRLSLQSYTRLNQFILALDMLINKRSNCYYATFNQITKSKGKVKKGSKSLPIQYFSYDIRHKETEERIQLTDFKALDSTKQKQYRVKSFIKYYRVFHTDNIENINDCEFPIIADVELIELDDCAENFINDLIETKNLSLQHLVQGEAYYIPGRDEIHLPKPQYFKNKGAYYSTVFHEIIHWSGHKDRLNRLDKDFEDGRNKYAFEELVAELGSLLFSLEFNYSEQFINSVIYLKSWLKHTAEEKKHLVLEEAFSYANRAINYLKL